MAAQLTKPMPTCSWWSVSMSVCRLATRDDFSDPLWSFHRLTPPPYSVQVSFSVSLRHILSFSSFSLFVMEKTFLSLSLSFEIDYLKRERERKEKRDNIFLLFWLVTASSLFSATLHNVVFSKRLLLTRNRKSLVPPTRPPPQKRSILSFISFFFLNDLKRYYFARRIVGICVESSGTVESTACYDTGTPWMALVDSIDWETIECYCHRRTWCHC